VIYLGFLKFNFFLNKYKNHLLDIELKKKELIVYLLKISCYESKIDMAFDFKLKRQHQLFLGLKNFV